MDPFDPIELKDKGLPPHLAQRLRDSLAETAAFANHALLQALFVDKRLRPWNQELPEASSIKERVHRMIALLYDQENERGENGLILLLQVLSEQTPGGNKLRYTLAGLGRELERKSFLIEPERAPYVGLATFQEEDAAFFFGRDALVAELLEKSKGNTFLAVLGSSGSGKSSVVRAGLLPALKRGELLGSNQWFYLTLRPGARPLESLAAALTLLQGGGLSDASTLRQTLLNDKQALLQAVGLLRAAQPDTRLVLVVDQFEELWTQLPSEVETRRAFQIEEQRPFIHQLLTTISAPDDSVLVIITLRTDFLPRAVEEPELARWITEHDVIIGPMQPDELHQAIARPAEVVGGRFEPGLAEALIAEVEGEPGALPLLEYTLLELWKLRHANGDITWLAYNDLGKLEGALAVRADAILDKHYRAKQREELRYLLLRLIQPGEGAIDTGRRMLIHDLLPSDGAIESLQALIRPLVNERLLVTGRDPGSGEETVEIAHEVLIHAWPTLQRWIDESRADLRQHIQLERSAREWEHNAEDPAFLWTGLRLANAEAWTTRAYHRFNQLNMRFLAASQEQEEQRRRAEKAREILARRVAIAISSLSLLVLLLTGVALDRQRKQTDAQNLAAQQTILALIADGRQSQGSNPQHALLLGLQALEKSTQLANAALVLESEVLLYQSLMSPYRFTFEGHTASVYHAEFSPDGTRVLTASDDGTARLWNRQTGELIATLDSGSMFGFEATFNSSGSLIITATGSEGKLWDAETGRYVASLEGPQWLRGAGFDFSPDDTLVASWMPSGWSLWRTDSGEELPIFDDEDVSSLRFSPDGNFIATAGGWTGLAHIWDRWTGERLVTLDEHSGEVWQVEFSPDGTLLITTDTDGKFIVWNSKTYQPIHSLNVEEEYYSVLFNPDSTHLLTYSVRNYVLWDLNTGEQIADFPGDPSFIPTFNPDGTRVVLGGGANSLLLVNGQTGELIATLNNPGESTPIAAFSPDGQWLATVEGNITQLRDGLLGTPIEAFTGKLAPTGFSPDGHWLVTVNENTAQLWFITGSRIATWKEGGHGFSPDGRYLVTGKEGLVNLNDLQGNLVASYEGWGKTLFSPGGRYLVTGSDKGMPRVWDLQGNLVAALEGHKGRVVATQFDPTGAYVLTQSWDDETSRLWNANTGQLIATFPSARSPCFSPDGTQILTTGDENTARLYDLMGTPLGTLQGHTGTVWSASYSPDGTRILTASHDGTARLWDRETQSLISVLEGHTSSVFWAQFNHDGTRILTAAGDGDNTARLWNGQTGSFITVLDKGINPLLWSASFNKRGSLLATAKGNHFAHLWDSDQGRFITTLEGHQDVVDSLEFSFDGLQLMTSSQDGTTYLWKIYPDSTMIKDEAEHRAPQGDTPGGSPES